MNHKRYSALILATALIIIGMRGVCMAQFSQRVSIERSHTQERNDVQLTTSVDKGTGFTFRVKKYAVQNPSQTVLQVKPSHRIYKIRQDLHVNPDKSCKSCETDSIAKPPGIKQ